MSCPEVVLSGNVESTNVNRDSLSRDIDRMTRRDAGRDRAGMFL